MLDAAPPPSPQAAPGNGLQIPLLVAAVLGTASVVDIAFGPRATASATPVGQTEGWRLVFEDEFGEDTLDPTKWVRCYWWDDRGCTNLGNKELEWYLPENVSVGEGALRLRAEPEIIHRGTATYEYSSGMVTTGRRTYDRTPPTKFEFQYGYAEIRARVPAGQGLWPAFWMLPARQVSLPEIDVMEVLGHEPEELHFNFHYRDAEGQKQNLGTSMKTADLSDDWHVYAVDWSPERIIWYFDGEERWRYEEADHVPHEPMYLILNLAVGGIWANAPDASTKFPADFLIDYVRVWQRED